MNVLIKSALVAAALAAPALSFAQSDTLITRAQVRAELTQLEQAGYQVGDGDNASCPVQLEAADACVPDEQRAHSGVGGLPVGSSQSSSMRLHPLYVGYRCSEVLEQDITPSTVTSRVVCREESARGNTGARLSLEVPQLLSLSIVSRRAESPQHH
ncbi:DUF4148 domain-containing protein [Caballeronia sp. LjRoot34]|uniref:DUF4148 domain-containing protein n=1 Tax=Caballeronia sp. LjRoot34 TaxID=3342325 RepID=UPI003ECDDE7B